MPRFSSNDMVHNHYLEEARKKTQESGRNSRPSMVPSARSQSIANDSKPKPRINNQRSRNWPASKSSCETTKTNPPFIFKWMRKTVPVAEGSSETTTEGYMGNYKNVSQDIRDQLNAKAEAVQIIITGIDNDIIILTLMLVKCMVKCGKSIEN
ncbi:hypothetical protein Tco_0815276 [Tanacetum coccineum]